MSNAACTKKRLCNDKAAAAQTSADSIVFDLIVPAMDRGELARDDGEKLIYAFAAVDEEYIARVDTLASETMAVFDRAATTRPPGGPRAQE